MSKYCILELSAIISVKPFHIHILSILLVAVGMVMIVFLYTSEPRSIAEVTTKGSVAIGAYTIDQAEQTRGIGLFREDKFEAARTAFKAADPEKLDARTQFLIAYSFYRQGWGRVSNDDDLFQQGLAAADRSLEIDPKFKSDEPGLALKTAQELKAELEDGLRVTASDFNPLKLTRERK